MCKQIFRKWSDALIKPKDTFRAEKKNASLSDAVKNMGVAGIIAAAINVSILVPFVLSGSEITKLFMLEFITSILAPIFALILLFASSAGYYIFAKILDGKGNYKTQTYLLSVYQSPILVITTLIDLIPVAGAIINRLIIGIYSLYLVTIALRETHDYSTGRAIASWLLPSLILLIIVVVTSYNRILFPSPGTLILPSP